MKETIGQTITFDGFIEKSRFPETLATLRDVDSNSSSRLMDVQVGPVKEFANDVPCHVEVRVTVTLDSEQTEKRRTQRTTKRRK